MVAEVKKEVPKIETKEFIVMLYQHGLDKVKELYALDLLDESVIRRGRAYIEKRNIENLNEFVEWSKEVVPDYKAGAGLQTSGYMTPVRVGDVKNRKITKNMVKHKVIHITTSPYDPQEGDDYVIEYYHSHVVIRFPKKEVL